jgi:hypothetical protein
MAIFAGQIQVEKNEVWSGVLGMLSLAAKKRDRVNAIGYCVDIAGRSIAPQDFRN